MIGLLQAELLKLRTIRTPAILLGVSIVIAVLAGGIQVGVIEYAAGPPDLDAQGMAFLIAGAASSTFMALIVGAVGATGEIRHRTEYLNQLISPQRWPQIMARVGAYMFFGLAFAIIVIGTVVALASAWAAVRVGEVPWGPDATRIVWGVVIISAAYMTIGLAIGTMIGNQAVAVVVVIVWPLFIEGLIALPLSLINPKLGSLMPFQAAQALLIGEQEFVAFGERVLAIIVLAWTVVLTAAGIWLSLRREAR